MFSKGQYLIGLLAAFATLLIAFITFTMLNGNVNTRTLSKDSEGFKIESKYKGDNKWEYVISGELLTPCHEAKVDVSILKSNPEKAAVTINIESPDPLEFCAQVTEEYSASGEYVASKDAELELSVVETNVKENTNTIEKEGFKLEGFYVGDRNWEYTITGTLPNPCYTAVADAMIAESFPEQVTVLLNVTAPEEGKICTQQIQDLQLTGEYQADEKATLNFRVVNK